jgi:polyhydroxyalkanoate synthase subunit PhaC
MTQHNPDTSDLASEAASNTLALNPLMAISPADLARSATKTARSMAGQPAALMHYWSSLASDMVQVATGDSDLAPGPKDRRFADPAWTSNPAYRRLMQAYLAWGKAVAESVEKADLDDTGAARARLVSSILVDTMAPSNNPVLNPAAMKALIDSGGSSAVKGLVNFLTDLAKNGGLPSSVDSSQFKLGKNVATSPGQVVFRNELLELVQYAPTQESVHQTPLVIVPPQINKFYSVDLSPEKSMIRYVTEHGIQPFCISWRNPTREQAHWGMTEYVMAVDAAVDAARAITGAEQVNVMGSCSGGITLTTYLAWLAAQQLNKVKQVIVAVCVLDTESADADNDLSALVTPETLQAAKMVSASRGVLDGQELAKMFAWMRPNDLIWNYWVNNYLLGKKPPAFDVLFWNADTTRLPAKLHADIDLGITNPFVNAGNMTIDGVPIDMSKIDLPTYVIAGTTDHITPWKAVYRTARLYGPKTEFVLSNSGHLQALLNPPGNPKSWFKKGRASLVDPVAWEARAKQHSGSWWEDWIAMLSKQSGPTIDAPTVLGNEEYVPLAPAPGTYVLEP